MVEESPTTLSATNNNMLYTTNDYIYAVLNNLAQALDTLQTRDKDNRFSSSHAPVINPFASTTCLPVPDQPHLILPVRHYM